MADLKSLRLIYAGAGQNEINKGTDVGTLSVTYDGFTATVTYEITGTNADTGVDYNLNETHLYVGNGILARDVNGDFTVAPGQYPTIHEGLNGTTTDTYAVSASGDIYCVCARGRVRLSTRLAISKEV